MTKPSETLKREREAREAEEQRIRDAVIRHLRMASPLNKARDLKGAAAPVDNRALDRVLQKMRREKVLEFVTGRGETQNGWRVL